MGYKAQNIDTERALDALECARKQQSLKTDMEIAEKKAYDKGFKDGIDWVEGVIFNTSNFEKKENKNE